MEMNHLRRYNLTCDNINVKHAITTGNYMCSFPPNHFWLARVVTYGDERQKKKVVQSVSHGHFLHTSPSVIPE